MKTTRTPAFTRRRVAAAALVATLGAGGCAQLDSGAPPAPVTIGSHGPNVVSMWNQVAHATVAVPPSPNGATPQERRPGPDVATVHIAIYDAVIAVAGTHRPFAVTPTAPAAGASMEAAAHEAAYRVLKALFPSRGAAYQAAYDTAMAAVPPGDAKTRGAAVGAEVAAGVLALRADDGRSTVLPAYVPGSGPGRFAGANPINQITPHLRPFSLRSASQFRPAAPPAPTSERYARDLQEVRELAGTTSTRRSAAQTETARFYTEPPPPYWARNLRRFASASTSLADNARLMAMLTVSFDDAVIACFDAKYAHMAWRPTAAIRGADVQPDPGWTPFLPTPNHPEYPAAHACAHGAVAQVLETFYGTPQLRFEFDSTVTGTTRRYASTAEMMEDVGNARVWGGMHFRFSNEAGEALGRQAARWALSRHFGPLQRGR